MIPSEITLYGQTIKTVIDNIKLFEESLTGQTDYCENIIRICSKYGSREVESTALEQTYCHELVHMLLVKSGWQDILFKDKNTKEHFVENFSALLHQALKSAKYEEIEKRS